MALVTFANGNVLEAQELNDSFAAVDWNENVVINGAMQVAQRGTSTASITTGGYYTADRWNIATNAVLSGWTQSVEADAPTGSGFRNSLKMLCTTAKASLSANDLMQIQQNFEGQNVQQFLKGTTSAKQFALSFWVKSNTTGTYTISLVDNDNTRTVSAAYTISASATWEKKTVIFPADTTGAFDNDNAASLRLNFTLLAGTDFTSGTLGTTWASSVSANRAVGQTNLASAINNYWQVTGVQLQPSRESQFLFQPYGTVLSQCQRYYYRANATTSAYAHFGMGIAFSTTVAVIDSRLPVTMRTEPTAVEYSTLRLEDTSFGAAVTALTINSNHSSDNIAAFDVTVASGLTATRPYFVGANNNTSAYLAVSAEL